VTSHEEQSIGTLNRVEIMVLLHLNLLRDTVLFEFTTKRFTMQANLEAYRSASRQGTQTPQTCPHSQSQARSYAAAQQYPLPGSMCCELSLCSSLVHVSPDPEKCISRSRQTLLSSQITGPGRSGRNRGVRPTSVSVTEQRRNLGY
jgi:hypothetical protein